jgi:hypothetical protein
LCPLTTPTTVNDSGTLLVAITSDTIRVFVMISYLGAQILVFYGEAAFDCTSTTPIELENQLSTFTGQECFGWDYYACNEEPGAVTSESCGDFVNCETWDAGGTITLYPGGAP